MRRLILIALCTVLIGCASVNEMKTTGEPPESWTNLYSASVRIVTVPKLVREPWNYLMGFVSAATGGGIDLSVEEP